MAATSATAIKFVAKPLLFHFIAHQGCYPDTYINDHRTGERREVVLPPIHAMLRNPPIDLITQTPTYQQPVIGGFPASRPPSPGVTSLSLPPPPGLVHPSLLTQTPITTQQSRPLTEGGYLSCLSLFDADTFFARYPEFSPRCHIGEREE